MSGGAWLGACAAGPELTCLATGTEARPGDCGLSEAWRGPRPKLERPCARREAFGEERRERLTTHDALSYLREVKTRFSNNRKVYDR